MNCLLCNGPCEPLGSLGRLMWFRCRNCGMNCSKKLRARKPRKCHYCFGDHDGCTRATPRCAAAVVEAGARRHGL